MLQKSPPPNRPLVTRLSGRCVFGIFGGFLKNWADFARNHYKNRGFGEIGAVVKKAFSRTEGWGGNLDPGPGESGPRKWPFWAQPHFGHRFPLLKCSVLQREAFWGPNSYLCGDQIPLLQHIHIYIYTCRRVSRQDARSRYLTCLKGRIFVVFGPQKSTTKTLFCPSIWIFSSKIMPK